MIGRYVSDKRIKTIESAAVCFHQLVQSKGIYLKTSMGTMMSSLSLNASISEIWEISS